MATDTHQPGETVEQIAAIIHAGIEQRRDAITIAKQLAPFLRPAPPSDAMEAAREFCEWAYSDHNLDWSNAVEHKLATLLTAAQDRWRPISEHKDESGLFGLHVVRRKADGTAVTEWQQYLGYRDDGDGTMRDLEYNEPLPWVYEDFTHFSPVIAPSPPTPEVPK